MAEVNHEKRAARRFPLRVPVSVSRNSNGSSEAAQIIAFLDGQTDEELSAIIAELPAHPEAPAA